MSNAPQSSPEKQLPTVKEVMDDIRSLPIKNWQTLNSFLNARGFTLSMPDVRTGFSCIREGDFDQLSEILTQYRVPEAVEAPEAAKDPTLEAMRGNYGKKAKKTSGTRRGRAEAYDGFDA